MVFGNVTLVEVDVSKAKLLIPGTISLYKNQQMIRFFRVLLNAYISARFIYTL